MPQTIYKVRMEIQANRKQFSIKLVPGRHMAYPNPAAVRLGVGTRVIAVFQDDESNNQTNNQNKGGSYYSGLIAEPPKSNNRFRQVYFLFLHITTYKCSRKSNILLTRTSLACSRRMLIA